MSSSVPFSGSFPLSRCAQCPPASLGEQRLAREAIRPLALRMLESLEQQCRQQVHHRRPESSNVHRATRAHKRQRCQQLSQYLQQHQHQEDEQREQQEEQEEQERQERQHWEATHVLCGSLAKLQDDWIASPHPQALNVSSTTITASAPIC